MLHLLWGCVLLISCTFILFLLKKSRNRKVFWYFCHVWILCGITLGILNIVFQKYDAYTSIYLGIICSCYTYYDNKQNPVSKRTNAYISSLQGYVAGIGFLLYGLLSLQNNIQSFFSYNIKAKQYELYLWLGNISVYNRNCNNVFSY